MPGPFSPTDDIIGPITSTLAAIITAQVTTPPNPIYTIPPDGQPEHNSLAIALQDFQILCETTGKLDIQLNFNLLHFIRESKFSDDIQSAYNYLHAYLNVTSAWANQVLQDQYLIQHARSVTPKKGAIIRSRWAGTAYIVAMLRTEIITEYNIPTGA